MYKSELMKVSNPSEEAKISAPTSKPAKTPKGEKTGDPKLAAFVKVQPKDVGKKILKILNQAMLRPTVDVKFLGSITQAGEVSVTILEHCISNSFSLADVPVSSEQGDKQVVYVLSSVVGNFETDAPEFVLKIGMTESLFAKRMGPY